MTLKINLPYSKNEYLITHFMYVFNFYNILLEDSEEEKYVKEFIEGSLASARAAGEKVYYHKKKHNNKSPPRTT